MRILLANDGYADTGGVETYLRGIIQGLRSRGHAVALLHHDRPRDGNRYVDVPQFGGEELGSGNAVNAAAAWHPDVVYSQNMQYLPIERRLLDQFAVVKFMHGYFGTCLSALKQHAFPHRKPCRREFGWGCCLHYFPRRCGSWNLATMVRQFRWTAEQQALLGRYRAVVVGSRHMHDEFAAHGVPAERLFVNPLFAPTEATPAPKLPPRTDKSPRRLLFLGRMTALKGGDVLLRAAAIAQSHGVSPLRLVLGGDGPQRNEWQRLAQRLTVNAEFPGWLNESDRLQAIRTCDLIVMPSVWPEPFGFVGLEAAQQGVPAVAFDVGGIREWLIPGQTGWLATGPRPTAKGLAEALLDALSDPAELAKRGQAARSRAAELSLAAHLQRLESLLKSVVAQR